jgi:hypothetical protein
MTDGGGESGGFWDKFLTLADSLLLGLFKGLLVVSDCFDCLFG